MAAGALTWLEQTSVAGWARESTWAYPALEIGHIAGFCVLVGSAVMFDLRLLGLGRALPIAPAARHLLGWSRWSLLLVAPTGMLLFAARATDTWPNPAFRLKLLLLVLAGTNALVFHCRHGSAIASWSELQPTPGGAKISAVVSLLLWLGVITCGRLIAYL